ncbi:MAG: hypothetical protein HZB32_04135 [Nitrospirae bacterium]|nr:hypothetical protein [Nitrospirota bacterium]
MKILVIATLIVLNFLVVQTAAAFDVKAGNLLQTGTAFITNLTAHEYGHALVGSSVGAEGISVSFFAKEKNNLFLGYTSMKRINEKAYPTFALGGEIGANVSFEYALQSYRKRPTSYNKALLFFSGTDFLWYSLYTFYLNEDNPDADPNILRKETGASKDIILSIAAAQSLLNGYRVISCQDKIIPYFTFDRTSIGFHVKVPY